MCLCNRGIAEREVLKIAEEYEVPIDENLKDFIYYDEFEVLKN